MKIPFKINALLWYLNRQNATQIYEMPAAKAREASSKVAAKAEWMLDYDPIQLFNVFDQNIISRNGDVPIRIYQPTDKKDLPVMLFFHGGGFVLRDIDSHDKVCRRLARDNNIIVISVGYRLAPENKFPAGLHDAYDATVWAVEHQAVHGGDLSRLLVAGDSAGANLAASVCLMARDLKGPKIKFQLLIYPVTDATLSNPSIDELAEGYILTKKLMVWFCDQYKANKEDLYNPLMSPLFAEDLSNLPPAFVLTAEYDPLKDDGRLYADRLKEAGNEVVFKEYGGMIHAFINMPKMSKKILGTYQDIKEVLAKSLEE